MICPKCKYNARVVDLVHNNKRNQTYRKLKCKSCGDVFYTTENLVDHDTICGAWKLHHRSMKKSKGDETVE